MARIVESDGDERYLYVGRGSANYREQLVNEISGIEGLS